MGEQNTPPKVSPVSPPVASPPASPDTCAQDGGGWSCLILGQLGPCASVSPSVMGLPWDGGTLRTLGEEEPLWPPCGDKDVAMSPRERGMKLEAPGIEARASHLPPHPHHRHSYPRPPFIPEFVTLLSPSPGRGGRSGCGHPTSLCGRRGGGWGSSSALSPSSSAAFGDHLPVPLLLLHQPGGEQGGGLRNPPQQGCPKATGRGQLTCGCGLP